MACECQGRAQGSSPGRKKEIQMYLYLEIIVLRIKIKLYLEIKGCSLNIKNYHLLSTKFRSVF